MEFLKKDVFSVVRICCFSLIYKTVERIFWGILDCLKMSQIRKIVVGISLNFSQILQSCRADLFNNYVEK